MQIKVEVKNEILGDRVFWEGDANNIDEIQNIPAKITAKKVVIDGKERSCGMWFVSVP